MRDGMGSQHCYNNQKGTNEDGDRISNLQKSCKIWTSIPCLNLSTQDFKTSSRFSKFVKRVLSRRNHQNRMNADGDVDRLSSLSDDLIHKIFSSYSTKLFVQTSVFSSRWRFIWTSIPCLNLSTHDFPTLSEFCKFITHVLSRRDNKIDVSSVKLRFPRDETPEFGFVKEIMDYAFYHNIQQLNVSYLPNYNVNLYTVPPLQIPNCNYFPKTGKSIWELPALTTLYLQCAVFAFDYNDSLFSSCTNLKNLTLDGCRTELSNFSICHPLLSNLTLDNSFEWMSVNVVAPKLEYLTVIYRDFTKSYVKISAPDLTSFVYKGEHCCLSLSIDGFNSLEEADIYVSKTRSENVPQILGLLEHLQNIRFLTLNMEILELLSSYAMKQISPRPFTFNNLKRLKIYPSESVLSRQQAPNKSYFLHSSPGATLEEIVAQSLVLELQVLIEEEKGNAETDSRAHTERGKEPMESHNAKTFEQGKLQEMRLQNWKNITVKNKSFRENPSLQITKRESKETLIISKLRRIELLLAKLPASKKALIKPCLASLRAEVDIVMGGITDCMKT